MKFIVNSSYFSHRITEAISEGAQYIKCVDDQLMFENPYKVVSFPVHFLETQNWDLTFDIFQWFNIVKSIQKIPEQPITVKIYEDLVEISMECQFRRIKK